MIQIFSIINKTHYTKLSTLRGITQSQFSQILIIVEHNIFFQLS